jgi:hypothetical protein
MNKNLKCEAPRPRAGAPRGGNNILIVPLDPANKVGLTGHLPAKIEMSKECQTLNQRSLNV